VIAFHWLDGECDSSPTLYFDCVLDAFFLCDILFSFSLGVNDGETYVDDWLWVATTYLKVRSRRESRPLWPWLHVHSNAKMCVQGGFLFDLCTSIPVAFVELAIIQSPACLSAAAGGEVPAIDPSQVKMMSILGGNCESVTHINSPKHGSFASSGSSNRCVGSSLLAS
jgi:hypothetical protein